MTPTLFDRYLLREWFQIIVLVTTALLGVLLIVVMYGDLPDLLEDQAALGDILTYFGVAIPSHLSVILPLTLLVSLLYVLGQMHRQHEFTALRAAGVSLTRITGPIWVLGALFCVGSWWLNSNVVPWAVEKSRFIKDEIRFRKEASVRDQDQIGAVPSVTFDNRKEGRLWFINRYSRFSLRAYGVSISFLDAERREFRRLFAKQAYKSPGGKGWTFLDGRELGFAPDTGENLSNKPFASLAIPELEEDPNLMLLIDRKVTDLSFTELKRLKEHLRETGSPKLTSYEVRYHSLLAGTLAPLIIIGIAIPFTMSGVRVNPAIGISKSIGLFAVYYLLAQLGSSLATKEILNAPLAAWVPNLGMCGVALWFLMRLR